MSKGPIRPEAVGNDKTAQIPEVVFEVVNALILEKIGSGREAIIRQDDILKGLEEAGIKIGEIFKKGWLDIEASYRAVGWKVEYDKPGHNESYPATFIFTIPSKR